MASTLQHRSAVPASPEAPTQLSTARLEPLKRNLERRVARLEQSNRYLSFALFGCVGLALALALALFPSVGADRSGEPAGVGGVAGTQEIKLVDASGRERFVVRMFSGTPVMQLIDKNGQSRLAFGLRLDEAPFVDLSAPDGTTRASLSLGGDNGAQLRIFDREGKTTFAIN